MGMNEASIRSACRPWKNLYTCYMETDASLAEINPLIHEADGTVKALDAKFNFDSNALYRQPEIVAMRDLDEEDADEIEASKFDLAYISLDGNIGCLVNGAGLAMATMDTIKLFGAEPANFLDVGGGATTEKVTEASRSCSRTQGQGHPGQHLRRHHALHTIATGVVAAARETHCPCRWSSA
jgi:succinyl-CoA synthetase beta subunit